MRERLLNYFLFAAFGFSGAAALIYEVVWTRSLSNVMGSSTYALTTMLAAFMAGLAVGGFIGSYITTRVRRLVLVFALCELGIGLVGLISIPVIEGLTPLYIISFYAFHLSFESFSFVQFIINFMIMGIPTTLMGITFPVLIKHFSSMEGDIGKKSGQLYGINTFGAILGTLAAGFFLIPLIGMRWTTISAAMLNITAAAAVLALSGEHRKAVAAAVATAVLVPASLLLNPSRIPFFSYYSANRFGTAVFASEVHDYISRLKRNDVVLFSSHGMDGDVYVMKNVDPTGTSPYILMNNGKLEGGDDVGFALLGLLPYFSHNSHEEPLSVLSIGLGSGNTLGNLSRLPVGHIDSVELNSGVIEANRRVLSPGLFADRRISHVHADGRNYLLLAGKKFDLIVVSPSWAVETSSAALLTDEFFSLASSRLDHGGVLSIWVDNFIESDEDMEIILSTVAKNFRYTSIWAAGGGAVITASNWSSAASYGEIISKIEGLRPDLKEEYRLAMGSDKVRALHAPINTIEKPVIEFSNAKSIILGPRHPSRKTRRS